MKEMSQVIDRLKDLAKESRWQEVDTLIDELRGSNNPELVEKLLLMIESQDPDFRDLAVSTLTVLDIENNESFPDIVQRVVDMAGSDNERFPAGRAAMFLWRYKENPVFREKITDGIDAFRGRKEIDEWKQDLIENIPGINELLK